MTRWYRAYEGTCTDPKLAEAALVAGCSRSVAVAAWHLTLENAATVNDGGRIDIPTRRIAAALCEPFADIETLYAAFEAIGLIVDSHVAAWKRRQYESDTSTERVRKHRKNKRAETGNGNETLQSVSVTAPETEAETYIPEANASGRSAIDFQAAIFKSGKALLMAAYGYDDRRAGSTLGRLRKEARDDALVLHLLAECEAKSISDPTPWLLTAIARGKQNGRNSFPKSTGGSTADAAQRVRERMGLAG